MRILLTNDDGIRAPGIVALHEALLDANGEFGGPLGELVWSVAPLTVQSATSHGVTFGTPLMVEPATPRPGMDGVAVDGRPADCVKLAICSLWPERFGAGERPDLVISGMNAGANVGINVLYSGTVAAAIEAAFLGVPSIAVSMQIGRGAPLFEEGVREARRVIERIVSGGLTAHECVSVNLPKMEAGLENRDLPVRVCPMNTHGLVDQYERRLSPSGNVYYWPSGSGLDFHAADAGTDVERLFRRQIAVTPLSYDLTDRAALARWSAAVGDPG